MVHEHFVNVKTLMGLEQFEVEKSRNSYDVPFRFQKVASIWLKIEEQVAYGKVIITLAILATATTSLLAFVRVIVGADL